MTAPIPAPQGPVLAAARQLLAAVADHQITGMLEVRVEAHELPHTLETIAEALRLRCQQHTRHPLDPAYAAAVSQIAATVSSAALAAKDLGPAFDALHAAEVRRLLQPRAGEQAWDITANQP